MKDFIYLAPENLTEAISLLSQKGKRARVMAGGTDFLVEMKNQEVEPETIIDLKRIPNLDKIDYCGNKGLRMGALVKIRDIETSKVIQEKFTILSQAAGLLGSVQVRNKATIGGNLCHASPSADMAPALIGLGATVKFVGKSGEKFLPLEEFFKGPGETVLKNNEILTEIKVPSMPDFSEGVYLKFSPRSAVDLAMVGVACVLRMDTNNSKCLDVRIVLGAVAPTPIRARKGEALIKGEKLSESLIKEAAKVVREEAKPISDIRASEWYRKEIVEVLVGRAISQASNKIKLKATRG